LITAGAAILFLPSVGVLVFIDRCLDAGGAVNYAEWSCSMNRDFPSPPTGTWLRVPNGIVVGTATAVVLAVAGVFAMIDRRQRRSPPAV
jgi:hypothetical protein